MRRFRGKRRCLLAAKVAMMKRLLKLRRGLNRGNKCRLRKKMEDKNWEIKGRVRRRKGKEVEKRRKKKFLSS